MKKKELIALLAGYPDDALVVIDVFDTTLYEDHYDFTFDASSWTRTFPNGTQKEMHELRLCAINNR